MNPWCAKETCNCALLRNHMGMTRAPLKIVSNIAADADILAKVAYVAEKDVENVPRPMKTLHTGRLGP